jgi:UDP:flavonoid glycosyltransferase YjiC (YdhE family)
VRVTIIAIGTRGDVQPYVALGAGLQGAGHDVRFATHPRFEPLVRRSGLDFAPVAEGDLSRGLETDSGRRWVETTSRRRPGWIGFLRDGASVAQRRLADCRRACDDAEAIVASMWGTLIGFQLAEVLRVPLVRAYLTPLGFHTPDNGTARRLPREAARRLGAARQVAIRQLLWQPARPWANAARRAVLGLPALPLNEPFGSLDRRGVPLLYGYSRAVIPRLLDEPEWLHVTGHWFADTAEDWEAPPRLADFLAAGPAPVFVSFGTRDGDDRDPVATTATVIHALARAGKRAVLARSQHAMRGIDLPDDIIAFDFVPHSWIYPRVAAAVHHGGAGSTAAALRAGLPSVVVPFYADQPFWARQVHRLGAAPRPIPRRRLSADRLADALRVATADATMRRRAQDVGRAIQAEDGVARAVEAFERLVAGRRAVMAG